MSKRLTEPEERLNGASATFEAAIQAIRECINDISYAKVEFGEVADEIADAIEELKELQEIALNGESDAIDLQTELEQVLSPY